MPRLPCLLLPILLLAACGAPPLPDEQEQAAAQSQAQAAADADPAPVAPPPADAAACNDGQAQWLVGKTPAAADLEQARKDTGATHVRALKPDQPVSLEFDAARLNVELDDKGAVVSVRCG
ncbi:MAG: I78 family peptidase inhibitor [Pseudoxanthomonas sp.]